MWGLILALVGGILAGRALTGQERGLALPFALDKDYEYQISGEMIGEEKFRIVDATGADGVKKYKLESTLDVKNQDGAFRRQATSYIFDAYGYACSYRGWREAHYPKFPADSGKEEFEFTFSPTSVHVKLERKDRPPWEADILKLPRPGVLAIDQDCMSHVALAFAGTSLGAKSRKESVSLFSFKLRERIRMSFDMVLTDPRRLWTKMTELGKVETDIYNVPSGTAWIRLEDRLLVKLASASLKVRVELIDPAQTALR